VHALVAAELQRARDAMEGEIQHRVVGMLALRPAADVVLEFRDGGDVAMDVGDPEGLDRAQQVEHRLRRGRALSGGPPVAFQTEHAPFRHLPDLIPPLPARAGYWAPGALQQRPGRPGMFDLCSSYVAVANLLELRFGGQISQ